MLASVIDNYRNSRAHFNTTQFNAWAVARRCMRFSRHNLTLRFVPPIVVSVAVMPISMKFEEGMTESPFDPKMFMEGGFLYEEPLNHYIRIQPFNRSYTFLVNAGYLANNFLESERQGYEALREVINLAKKEDHTTHKTPGTKRTTSKVQEESSAEQERDSSRSDRDDSKGE